MTTSSHAQHTASISTLMRTLQAQRYLIVRMAKREVVGRYRGSVLGMAWSFFNPILMLAVYTFVFSVVFKAKWGIGGDQSQINFAVVLFVGMVVHGLFAEIVNAAPKLILFNVSYVKKVVFPLEILPIVSMGNALFHTVVSSVVLLLAIVILNGGLEWTIVFFPLVIFPLLVALLGVGWCLAALGVFVRDIGQVTGMLTTVMLFLSPVFYPLSILPEKFQFWLMLNPLTFMIEESRAVLLFGKQPDWFGLGIYTVFSVVVAWLGFWIFQRTRNGFADVL